MNIGATDVFDAPEPDFVCPGSVRHAKFAHVIVWGDRIAEQLPLPHVWATHLRTPGPFSDSPHRRHEDPRKSWPQARAPELERMC